MAENWFEDLMGFRELSYDETKRNLEVVGTTLRSRVNDRSYSIGELETPSTLELRNRAERVISGLAGKLKVSNVSGDVRRMHRDPINRYATFQVASQFNLLEMVGPQVSPEDGVTRYINDRTQGPACAIAAGAATVYRNYFVPVDGQTGQTRHRQIDCLSDLGAALGNERDALWRMSNGYALCTENGLAIIAQKLEALDAHEIDELRDRLRVGVHSGVQVTDADATNLAVSQVFCSALPVSYSNIPADRWKSFAVLLLEDPVSDATWRRSLRQSAAVDPRRHAARFEEGGGRRIGCARRKLSRPRSGARAPGSGVRLSQDPPGPDILLCQIGLSAAHSRLFRHAHGSRSLDGVRANQDLRLDVEASAQPSDHLDG